MILRPLRLSIYIRNRLANQAWSHYTVFVYTANWTFSWKSKTRPMVIVKHGLVSKTTVRFRKRGFLVKRYKIMLSCFSSRENWSRLWGFRINGFRIIEASLYITTIWYVFKSENSSISNNQIITKALSQNVTDNNPAGALT